MIRQLLLVMALVGFVLSGASMSTHPAGGAQAVDLVAASAVSDEPGPATAVASVAMQVVPPAEIMTTAAVRACLDCTDEPPVHDSGMLMLVGCLFVALAVGAWAFLFLRRVRNRWPSPFGTQTRFPHEVWRATVVVPPPPDLFALGVSRT